MHDLFDVETEKTVSVGLNMHILIRAFVYKMYFIINSFKRRSAHCKTLSFPGLGHFSMSGVWLEIINTDKQTGHFECWENVKLLNDFVVC